MYTNAPPTSISSRLIKEAIRQTALKGAGNVSAKSVVRAVGCSDRLIQYYFTSVEGMWKQAVKYCQDALYDAYSAFMSMNGQFTLFDIWRFFYRYSVNHPDEMTFYCQIKLLGLYSYAPSARMNDLMLRTLREASLYGSDDEFTACKRMEFICDSASRFAVRVTKGELPGGETHVKQYMNITFGLPANE